MTEIIQKPFTLDEDYAKLVENAQNTEVITDDGKKLKKPFLIESKEKSDGSTKLYLILLYFESRGDDCENVRDFAFITGRDIVYKTLKEYLEDTDSDLQLDAMKSRVLVDSPKVQISHPYSVFAFMRDMKEKLLVTDNSSFDIYDYYYDEENEDGEEQQ